MKIKQQLNNYTNTYLKYDGWLVLKTDHYVFHFLQDSVASSEIKKISQRQEEAFNTIVTLLSLPHDQEVIHYYLYPSSSLKKRTNGR